MLMLNDRKITSREIAEITGKPHADLMKAIRVMEDAWVNVGQGNFSLTYYTDQWNRKQPQYELSKKECLYIATKFNDEARAKLIIRWEQLETQHSLPQSFSEALMLAARQAEELEQKERQLQLQEHVIKESAPKVKYYEKVMQSGSLIATTVIAKELGISAKSLNKLLNDLGIIHRVNGVWVLYQKYQNKGYTGTKTYNYTDANGNTQTEIQTYWYEPGREFIHRIVKEHLMLN